jgi:hypothetical protein
MLTHNDKPAIPPPRIAPARGSPDCYEGSAETAFCTFSGVFYGALQAGPYSRSQELAEDVKRCDEL